MVYLGIRKLKNSAKYRYQARTPPTATGIATMVSSLSKTPVHLSAIFGAGACTNEADTNKLIQNAAELAAWSVAGNIPILSIYDKQGILKKNARSLQIFASLRIKQFIPSQKHRVCIHVDGRQSSVRESPDGEPPGLTIYLISEEDGRCAIGSITDALAEKVRDGDVTIDEVSTDLLAEQLYSSVMPAPDLVVVFGTAMKLCGYPPWHLQQAEIETLRDSDEFTYVAFAHALRGYARAEMRHGK
ncbi:hypothetical protein V2A60_004971 [Cordyceps javanica]